MHKINRKLSWTKIAGRLYIETETEALELNKMGAYIFDKLVQGNDERMIKEQVKAKYPNIDEKQIVSDINLFISYLASKNILESENTREIPNQNLDSKSNTIGDLDGSLKNEFEELSLHQRAPFGTTIELTSYCNFDCVHCVTGHLNKRSEIPINNLFTAVEELKKNGGYALMLTGGEPCTRKDLPDIINKTCDLGFKVTINTNGSLLTNNIIEICKDRDVNISVTIYGVNNNIYEKVTRRKNSYNLVFNNLIKLSENGNRFNVAVMLLKENVAYIDDFDKIFKKIGKESNYNLDILPCRNGCKEPLSHKLSFEDILKIRDKIKIPNRSSAVPGEGESAPIPGAYCSAGTNMLYINSSSEILPCGRIPVPVGNIKNTSIREALENSELVNKIRQINSNDYPTCKNCGIRKFCSACIGENYLFHNDFFQLADTKCENAKIRALLGN